MYEPIVCESRALAGLRCLGSDVQSLVAFNEQSIRLIASVEPGLAAKNTAVKREFLRAVANYLAVLVELIDRIDAASTRWVVQLEAWGPRLTDKGRAALDGFLSVRQSLPQLFADTDTIVEQVRVNQSVILASDNYLQDLWPLLESLALRSAQCKAVAGQSSPV